MIKLEIIDNPDRLAAIEDEWNYLWLAERKSVFQSHGWISAWYRHFAPLYRLRIAVAWRDDRLAAVLPCAIYRYHGVRILEWAAQAFTDYCDGFGERGLIPDLWRAVERNADIVRLKNVSHGARVSPVLAQQSRLERHDADVCLKIQSTWANGEAWWRNLNRKKRNNHTRGLRILEESGEVQILHQDYVSPRTVERLFALKREWMNANNMSSPLMDADVSLLADLVRSLDRTGKLRVAILTCNHEMVAASINILDGTRLLAFLAAYDPKFQRASPGILLMNEYTRWAFDRGITEIDYLRGTESYKFEFANERTPLQSFIGPVTLKGRAALALYNTTQRLRAAMPTAVRNVGSAYTTKAGTPRANSLAPPRVLETEINL